MSNILAVDAPQLMAELESLSRMTDEPSSAHGNAVTRVLFTPRDLEARQWLKSLARTQGFSTREDAVGNLFVRLEGTEPDLPAVATGSHTDAIPHAGMYDGTVGVLGGLAALRAIQQAGTRHRRSIELVMLTAEEPTRFGMGCLGSRLLAGALDPEKADALCDVHGESLAAARSAAGYSGPLAKVRLQRGHYHAWLELHIEQGPLLERDRIDLGLVTSVAAPASFRISIEGQGGHAGALLMLDRHDALCAAAEFVLAVERAALQSGSVDTVATVGTCQIFPGAINSVPSRTDLTLDLRDTVVARRDATMQRIRNAMAEIAQRRNVTFAESLINADAPVVCDPSLVDLLEQVAKEHGISSRRMVSRAYHDTLFLAAICPVAMLFIPCRNGVSHRPDEFASPDAIERGASVLAVALARLASE